MVCCFISSKVFRGETFGQISFKEGIRTSANNYKWFKMT